MSIESFKEWFVVVLVLTFTECNLCQCSGKSKACVFTDRLENTFLPSALQGFFLLEDVFLETQTVSVYMAMLTKIANLKRAAANAAFW